MRLKTRVAPTLLLLSSATVAFSQASNPARQTPVAATAPTAVPALVPFSSTALSPAGKPLSGEVTATILLYKDEIGGEPLWSESQTASLNPAGHYQLQLGASSPSGLPLTLFSTGEGRWIEVLIPGQAAQPRVLLMSVPYAMKSADAATLGGLPPSAFALARPSATQAVVPSAITPDASTAVTTPGGTSGFIPAFTGAATIANTTIFQNGTLVGLNTTVPQANHHINGTTIHRGSINLPNSGSASASAGSASQPINFSAGAYNSSTPGSVFPTFQLKAEPTANNTSAPAATFNFLYNASNSATPTETGLSIASNGLITFAKNQTFPGTGTVTSLAAASPLTIGGANGVLNVSLNTSALESTLNGKYIQASAANHFTGLNTFAGTSQFNGPTSFSQPVTFASSQTFGTGAGSGTITGVGAGTGLTGGGTTGKVTLAVDTSVVPTLAGGNYFTLPNQFVVNALYQPALYGENSVTTAQNGTKAGVYGLSDSAYGSGVTGVSVGASQLGKNLGYANGVWGDTNQVNGIAVLGTADDGFAGYFTNEGSATTLEVANYGGGPLAFFSADGVCEIDNSGDLSCSGTKSAVVPVDNATRQVALYAVESPENWFEDFGSGQLESGSASVSFESVFAQTVNLGTDYKVFVTPTGDCKGLYVTNKTATGFQVRELGSGRSTLTFDYRIVARRKGYETIRLADRTKEMDRNKLGALQAKRENGKPQP